MVRACNVSVVLVNYNGARDLSASLPSLLAQTGTDFEVIVVDNGSADDSLEMLRKRFPEVRTIPAGKNLGFGAGNNLGVRHARGTHIVFTNYDVEFADGWLRNLVAAAESSDVIGIVAPRIMLFDQRDLVQSCGLTFQYTGHAFTKGYLRPAEDFLEQSLLGSATGCCFLIKKSVFDSLGGFDEDFHRFSKTFFHSSLEDVDLSWRAQIAGFDVVLEPSSVLYHKYLQKPLSPLRHYYLECGRYSVLAQNYSASTLAVLSLPLAFSETLGWAFTVLKGPRFVSSKVRSYGWFLSHFPQILAKRARVQSTRVVSDAVILPRFQAETQLRHVPLPAFLKPLALGIPNYIFRKLYTSSLAAVRFLNSPREPQAPSRRVGRAGGEA